MKVGIIGGGQLGRMLALAGHELGIDCTTLDPAEDSPASQVAPAIVGAYDDPDALLALADGADVVTYEFENVPAASTRFLAERDVALYPPPRSLEVAQDRLEEKTLFTEVGLTVPTFAAVDDLASLEAAVDAIGLPAVLKTRRLGYDGKGQAVIRHGELAEDAWRSVGEVPSILEALVGFDREVSILGVRSHDGETAFWPVVENRHVDGILRTTTAPAPRLTDEVRAEAEGHGAAVMDRLGHVGVLAIELFQVGEHLLGNEVAPRVHNSGHWTIEGAHTSQFENHLRAVTGLPLGDTGMDRAAGMVNLIGSMPDETAILAVPEVHLHRYGKTPRPGRKIGHVTVLADAPDVLHERMLQVTTQLADSSFRMAYLTCPDCMMPNHVGDDAIRYHCFSCSAEIVFQSCEECDYQQAIPARWQVAFTCGRCGSKVEIPRRRMYSTSTKALKVRGFGYVYPKL